MRPLRKKVTVDANIIVAALVYGSPKSQLLIDTVNDEDELVMTNIILMQCARQGKKKGCPLDCEEIERRVRAICKDVVMVEIIPLEKLKERYYIRDDKDYEILYSADVTESDFLVTTDKDFFDPRRPVKGLRAKILHMDEYLRRKRPPGEF